MTTRSRPIGVVCEDCPAEPFGCVGIEFRFVPLRTVFLVEHEADTPVREHVSGRLVRGMISTHDLSGKPGQAHITVFDLPAILSRVGLTPRA